MRFLDSVTNQGQKYMADGADNTVVFLASVPSAARQTTKAPIPLARPKINLSEGLDLWRQVTVQSVRASEPDLSTRQMAVLMTIYLSEGPHTVRSLAKHLEVTKAVISRAIDRLTHHGYVERAPDHRDKRSVVMCRTSGGIHYLRNFARIIQTEFTA